VPDPPGADYPDLHVCIFLLRSRDCHRAAERGRDSDLLQPLKPLVQVNVGEQAGPERKRDREHALGGTNRSDPVAHPRSDLMHHKACIPPPPW
jgi:hypothetical protein